MGLVQTYLQTALTYLLLICSGFILLPTQVAAQTSPPAIKQITATPSSTWQHSPQLSSRLLSEFVTLSPGHIYTLALELEPAEGWHSLWLNPGDLTAETQLRFEWYGPQGTYFDDSQWPQVQCFFTNSKQQHFGFAGKHYLLTDFSLPADYFTAATPLASPARLAVTLHWHLCNLNDLCVQGQHQHEVILQVAASHSEFSAPELAATNQAHFLTARQNLPQFVSWPARYDIQGEYLTLIIEAAAAVQFAQQTTELTAYLGIPNLVATDTAAQITSSDDLLVIQYQKHPLAPNPLPEFLPLQLNNGQNSLELLVAAAQTAPASPTKPNLHLSLVFAFAFLGGFILNLMPCVFPVLSLKAMALAQQKNRQHVRNSSLWYSLGVLISFLIIAAVLLLLRATGQALGWGFQLQNPWLIASLAILFVAIGLNLTGVFQVATRLMGLGHGLANDPEQKQTNGSGSFATGVLAVLVASPCTAPFMGVALGYAITQTTTLALAVFAVLGLGFAAPFLLLGFAPRLAHVLPKPGAWMESFKQWMALPMYLTAVWLVWVFGRQTSIDSLALLLVTLVFVATTLWLWGVRQLKPQQRQKRALNLPLGLLMLLSATSFYYALTLPVTTPAGSTQTTEQTQVWSATKLTQLRQQQPVFVNMTADWCITCLANERIALNTAATQALFEHYNVAQLTGDWTLQDPNITEYLAEFGRNGVPLYVLYWPEQEPLVLPQILTPGLLREVVETQANQAHINR